MKRVVASVAAVLWLVALAGARDARAGTTGAIVGRVVDSVSKTGLAAVTVAAVSPSQSASTSTDANGEFRFLSLAPDTYVVSVTRQGYDPLSLSGVTVQADQTQSVPAALTKTLATIGRVSARSSAELLKPGTTSDVYSVNAAGAEAAAGLGGPGGLNNAYSAIASVPGTSVQQGQQGWYQQISIRGGDIDQVGYELDGIPVNRAYDNAPETMLSTLGQQELQVYTGGTPATSDGQGLSGYVNQVIKTGTYPSFTNVALGLGGPQYYHKFSFEFGGTSASRLFSYYVGLAGANQSFRYLDNANGTGDPRFFYPVAYPFGDNFSRFNLYDGSPNPLTGAPATVGNGLYFAPGSTYAISNLSQRDTVVNLHFGLPHRGDGLRDDLQLLYTTSEIFNQYYSSINDQGGPVFVGNALSVGNGAATSGNASWHDGYVYNGALFAPPDPSKIVPYFFPSSPAVRAFGAALSNDARDSNDNGVAVLKLQYQKNINSRSYLRLFGYSVYSNWFITGDSNQNLTCCFGAELNDYEIPSHTYGGDAIYSNQLSDKHLLTLSAAYSQTKLQRRYFYQFPGNQNSGWAFTNLIDPASAPATGNCFDPASGGFASCFKGPRGTFVIPAPGGPADPSSGTLPVTATAFAGGAQPRWTVTENGPLGRINNVSPIEQAVSLTDQWRPDERLTVNFGARVENYVDRLADTSGGPNRAFWVKAYNNEYCFKPGVFGAVNVAAGGATPNSLGVFATPSNCAAVGNGYVPADFINDNGSGKISSIIFQPRVAATFTLNPDSVLRASYGVYSRPVNTSWLQYNNLNDRDFLGYAASNFIGYGFNTPRHNLRPDSSYNYDLSLEQHLAGTPLSFKVSPFYRSTRDQLQAFPIGVGGIVSGFNVGHQTSTGVELALRAGDFSRDGLSAQLAYTYTRSRIKYATFPSGTNVIDSINLYVQEYNSFTSACASITGANAKLCGLPAGTANGNAQAAFTTAQGTVANPYYGLNPQPLFDVTGEYTTYDQIPQPFVGENGYETPSVLALLLNYKHKQFNFTPSLTLSSGASYGSPLSYPGYIPSGGCTPATGSTAAIPYTCSGASAVSGLDFLFVPDAFTGRFDGLGAFKEPSRLTVNLGVGYEASPNVKFTANLTGLVDKCFQRGYAWDDPNICVYSELPSGGAGLGPSGNFIPIGSTPVQLRYPYGAFNDNLNTGFVGTVMPVQATVNVQIKL